MKRGAGYIAIDRGIFDHWISRNAKRFKAWQWMIAEAAYVPKGKRGTWGVVHLERGQLVGSEWMLAARWRWKRSAVHRFLVRLERDGMITRLTTRTVDGRAVPVDATISEQPTEQPNVPHLEHDVTVITVCNYDAFNTIGTAAKNEANKQPNNRPENDPAQSHMFPQFCTSLTTKPLNQETESLGDGGEAKIAAPPAPKPDTGPRHGASSKHGNVFVRFGTEDWRIHAADYREVMGAEPLPDRHGGFWFYILGEAARPANQRTWRRRDAFGMAARGRPPPRIEPPPSPGPDTRKEGTA